MNRDYKRGVSPSKQTSTFKLDGRVGSSHIPWFSVFAETEVDNKRLGMAIEQNDVLVLVQHVFLQSSQEQCGLHDCCMGA